MLVHQAPKLQEILQTTLYLPQGIDPRSHPDHSLKRGARWQDALSHLVTRYHFPSILLQPYDSSTNFNNFNINYQFH